MPFGPEDLCRASEVVIWLWDDPSPCNGSPGGRRKPEGEGSSQIVFSAAPDQHGSYETERERSVTIRCDFAHSAPQMSRAAEVHSTPCRERPRKRLGRAPEPGSHAQCARTPV